VAAESAEAIFELGTEEILEETRLILEVNPAEMIDFAATDWTREVLTEENSLILFIRT
jgi:hypothetical protein